MLKSRIWLWTSALLAIPAWLSLISYAYLGSFSRLIADDFCSIYMANRLGLLRSVWFWYKTWSGCYSASVIDSLLSISPYVVSWGVGLLVSAWLIGTTWCVFLSLPTSYPKNERFWIALILSSITSFGTLILCPSPAQSLFWWGGLRSYLLPLVIFIFGLAVYYQINRSGNVKFNIWFFLLGLGLSVFGAGFSETLTPVLVVFWAALVAMKLWKNRPAERNASFYYALAYLLGTFVGLVVMVLAPGNAIRQALFPKRPDLFEVLSIASIAFVDFLMSIFKSPLGLMATAALFGVAFWIGIFKPYQAVPKWYSPAALLAGFIFAFGCFPPAAFGMAEPAPNRTLILAVFFLMTGFVIAGYLFGSSIKIGIFTKGFLLAGLYIFILMAISGAAWVNFSKLNSYRQILESYAIYWDGNQPIIRQAYASGQKKVTIHSIRNWAGLNDPGENPKFWVNYCMSSYYGLDILSDNSGMQPSGNAIP